ncbi:hypothetical protein BOTBODRAFT_612306 [Botryobasidium botryosum FD-172 SS1]|uniref:Uncharacterized protein n=1 Tax=Botryobasidium botryosum (strain FD-172 SS1) TaxID=930990 RepID=A0A067LVX3_BOTB1|nr:hypothetical protein BOTBODRAFT_612306 [Botryobasidium botryosum FD-172 SS1]
MKACRSDLDQGYLRGVDNKILTASQASSPQCLRNKAIRRVVTMRTDDHIKANPLLGCLSHQRAEDSTSGHPRTFRLGPPWTCQQQSLNGNCWRKSLSTLPAPPRVHSGLSSSVFSRPSCSLQASWHSIEAREHVGNPSGTAAHIFRARGHGDRHRVVGSTPPC